MSPCARCRSQEGTTAHPHIDGLHLCDECTTIVNAKDWVTVPADGNFEWCTICAETGKLFCCSKCAHAVCKTCTSILFGSSVVTAIAADDDWGCFACCGIPDRVEAPKDAVLGAPPKKKPQGRPRKNPHSVEAPKGAALDAPPKKKPQGRPRKNPQGNAAGSGAESQPIYTCPECSRSFTSDNGLAYHVRQQVCTRKRKRIAKTAEAKSARIERPLIDDDDDDRDEAAPNPEPTPEGAESDDGDDAAAPDSAEGATRRPRRNAAKKARRLSKATVAASREAGDSDVSDDAASFVSADNESSDDDDDDGDMGAEELSDLKPSKVGANPEELDEVPDAKPAPKQKRRRKKAIRIWKINENLRRNFDETSESFRLWNKRLSEDQIVHAELRPSPSDYDTTGANLATDFMPQCTESPPLIAGDDATKIPLFKYREVKSGDADTDLKAFVGGAITHLEWCPGSGSTEFLSALSVSGDTGAARKPLALSSMDESKYLLQLWELDCTAKTLSMSLGLCLDVGIVKDIAWCPSGWEPEASGEPMARFGLLAVAAKSSVLVFAVPHPSALKGEGSPPVGPLLAMAKPVLELADGTLPVTALSWSSDETHEWIAAGRVDGSIAFYNLTSKGQTSPNQTRLVVPEFVVTTNNGYCIRTLSFCPEDPGLLAVAGHFDLVELWDLSEPLNCIAAYKKPGAWIREISWPYGHRGMYYVCEDLGIRHLHLDLQRKMGNNTLVTQSGATATDVAVSVDASSWHGLMACTSDSGSVTCAIAPMIPESTSVAKADFVRFSVAELGPPPQPLDEAAATPAAERSSEYNCSFKVRFCCNDKGKFWLASSSADGTLLLQDIESRAKTARAEGYHN